MALHRKLAVLALASVLVAGCATPPPDNVPATPTPPSYSIGPNPLVVKEFGYATRALDDKNSIVYLQTFGGGGAAVGVLLGPLGVAANMSMIGKVTDDDVLMLKGRITVDPVAVFGDIAREYPAFASPSAATNSVLLTPLLNVVKQENEDLLFGCTLLVDYSAVGATWVGRYAYQLPVRYAKAAVAQGLSAEQQALLAEELRAGFRVLARLYLDDAAGRLPRGGEVKFRSTFVQPRLDFEITGKQLPGEPDRLNVSIGYGRIYSLPRDPSQVKVAAPQAVPARPAPAPQPSLAMAAPAPSGDTGSIPPGFVRTPLPDDVKVPPRRYGLTGIWTGKWGNDLDITLIVEEVNGRTARVVYSWGVSPRIQGPDKPGFQRVSADIDNDGTLRVSMRNGATALYRLSQDGRSLSGQYFRNRFRTDGTFEKRELP